MSSDFELFEGSLHRSGGRECEEYDLRALERLSGSERERAEGLLMDRLRSGDHRAVQALRTLSTTSSLRALREALPAARGMVLASLASALKHSDPGAARDAAFRALRSDDGSVRVGGIQVLSDLPGDDVDAALLAAVDDAVSNVRAFATEALFQRLGLRALEVPRRGLTLLRMRLCSDFESLRKPALVELVSLVDRVHAGHSPDALGPIEEKPLDSPAYQAWVHCIRAGSEGPYAGDFDLDALDALSAEDRAWAEVALINRLGHFDPRVPRALRHMKSRLALAPMRELLRTKVHGAPGNAPLTSWPEPARRFVGELVRAIESDLPPGGANE